MGMWQHAIDRLRLDCVNGANETVPNPSVLMIATLASSQCQLVTIGDNPRIHTSTAKYVKRDTLLLPFRPQWANNMCPQQLVHGANCAGSKGKNCNQSYKCDIKNGWNFSWRQVFFFFYLLSFPVDWFLFTMPAPSAIMRSQSYWSSTLLSSTPLICGSLLHCTKPQPRANTRYANYFLR